MAVDTEQPQVQSKRAVKLNTDSSGIVIPTPDLVARYGEIYSVDGNGGSLKQYNVERDDEIELLGLCVGAGVDPLFLGDPGTGKTWLIEMVLRSFAESLNLFDILIMKEMGADELVGPRSIPAMKAGKVERVMDGFLPTAHIGYLDEVMKGSPPVMNAILDLQANRQLKVGGKTFSAKQLILIIGSSNELPDREDLMAFRDRWGVTKFVQPVRAPDGKRRVMQIQHEAQSGGGRIDFSGMPKLSLDDLAQIQAEAMAVRVDGVLDAMIEAQDQWEAAGHPPSQRRIGQILRVMKMRAWSKGRGELTRDDMTVSQHMAWNHPDHAESAYNIALNFANRFARKAMQAREALEPILTEMGDLKAQIQQAGSDQDALDALMEQGFKVINKLRRQRREVESWIEDGRNQAEDVRELEKVLDEIQAQIRYAEDAFTED